MIWYGPKPVPDLIFTQTLPRANRKIITVFRCCYEFAKSPRNVKINISGFRSVSVKLKVINQ